MPALLGLVYLVLALALVGFLVYLITTYIPMPDLFKTVIFVVVAVVVVVMLLSWLSGQVPHPRW